MSFERELSAVQRWVAQTDAIAREHFRIDVPYETKADGTPVTEADRAVERALREAIEAEFPGDAILGEEEGLSGEGARRWIIDPIDGTKNFARGVPVFATLIALEVDGALALGMVSAPAFEQRWWATRGGGAFRDGERIRVSTTARIEDADVCTGSFGWGRASGGSEKLLALCDRARRQRGFGDWWGHLLVAQGSMDAMVDLAPLQVYDIAAPKLIVEEAGGRVTTLTGDGALQAGAAITTNGALHDAVLDAMR